MNYFKDYFMFLVDLVDYTPHDLPFHMTGKFIYYH